MLPESNIANHFTGNLDRAENTKMFFIFEEEKETILDFSQGKCCEFVAQFILL